MFVAIPRNLTKSVTWKPKLTTSDTRNKWRLVVSPGKVSKVRRSLPDRSYALRKCARSVRSTLSSAREGEKRRSCSAKILQTYYTVETVSDKEQRDKRRAKNIITFSRYARFEFKRKSRRIICEISKTRSKRKFFEISFFGYNFEILVRKTLAFSVERPARACQGRRFKTKSSRGSSRSPKMSVARTFDCERSVFV